MRKRRILVALLMVLSIFILACTANQRARKFGGKATVNLSLGKKLVSATWKDEDSLWYIVRDAKPGEKPETLEFIEDSSLGIVEGKVVFIEH